MKKELVLISFIFLSFSSLSFAQDNSIAKDSLVQDIISKDTIRYWSKGGMASLNINQVSLTNWAAGGQSSFSGTALFNGFSNYKRGRVLWENSLDLGYGIIKIGDNHLQKNEDRIIVNSKYGKQISEKWYLSTLLNFRSQFAPGYNYPNDSVVVSKFLAPAFLIVSLGFDYHPHKSFSLYLSPATGKFTFVNDQQLANIGSYGVTPAVYDTSGVLITPGKKFRPEFGAYLSAKFEKNIMENVTVKSRLDLFDNYTDKNKENRGNIDVNWETNLNFRINKYISTSLFTHLIYDHDILVPIFKEVNGARTMVGKGRRVQFKEVFGLSFAYKF